MRAFALPRSLYTTRKGSESVGWKVISSEVGAIARELTARLAR